MEDKLNPASLEDSNESPAIQKAKREPVLAELVLEAHCRLATSIHFDGTQESPQQRLITLLRRTYKSGNDPELEYTNFTEEFQTPQLQQALNAFAKRRTPKRTK
jgi:hypothetical protein